MSDHFNTDLTRFQSDTPVNQIKNLVVSGTQGMIEAYTREKPDISLAGIVGTYLSGSDNTRCPSPRTKSPTI